MLAVIVMPAIDSAQASHHPDSRMSELWGRQTYRSSGPGVIDQVALYSNGSQPVPLGRDEMHPAAVAPEQGSTALINPDKVEVGIGSAATTRTDMRCSNPPSSGQVEQPDAG